MKSIRTDELLYETKSTLIKMYTVRIIIHVHVTRTCYYLLVPSLSVIVI